MRKRIVAILAAMGIIALGIAWFAGEESYVLDVKAKLSTALDVSPHGNWDLGTVYAQQKYDTPLVVHLSASAKADPNLSSVQYVIGCNKPVPAGDGTRAEGPVSICPYVELQDDDNNSVLAAGCSATQGPKCNSFESGFIGLTKAANTDTDPVGGVAGQPGHVWKIQINPPTCVSQKNPNKQTPVDGSCDQDNPLFMRGGIFIRLNAPTASDKQPCDKKNPGDFCKPDLIITSVIENKEIGAPTCTVTVTVKNQATHKSAIAGASNTRVALNTGGGIDNHATPSLGPGISVTYTTGTLAKGTSGFCDGVVTADFGTVVTEANEGNNTGVVFDPVNTGE